ncbi:hypothetical protein DYB32_008357 [Aphanomyces invadans]|uniref:MIF4G domain-containing protein n=1 Tax=Aphanomyces invadans TaxID=157072 RepID=A0A3R6YU26_9STRA|nr:hypothetical protein DYB32_008357 [Aphanomyces invadans]
MADYNRDNGRGGGPNDRASGYDDNYRRRKRSDDSTQYGGGYSNDGYKRHRQNDYRGNSSRHDNYRGRDNYRDQHHHRSGDDDALELRRRVISLGDSVNVNDSLAVRDVLTRCGDWLGEQLMFQAQEIAALVVTCAGRLSAKTEWYGMLTTLLNEKNAVFGKKVVELALQAIQTDLTWWATNDSSTTIHDVPVQFQRIKSLVRFIGNLTTTKMILAPDMVALLATLHSVCAQPLDGHNTTARAHQTAFAVKDYFSYIVLDTILHCGHTLVVAAADPLDQLLAQCDDYITCRDAQDDSNRLVPGNTWLLQRIRLNLLVEPEDPDHLPTFAKSLVTVAKQMPATTTAPDGADPPLFHPQWKIQSLLYPLLNFLPVVRKTESAPLPSSIVTWDGISLTQLSSKVPPYPLVHRILDDDSGPIGSAIGNMNLPSYLISRSYFEDIVESFRPNPTEAAKQLLATCRALNGRWNLQAEYILVEALLVSILSAPAADNMVAYGGAVLFHLLKQESKTIQSAFAILVELLFRRVPLMPMNVVDTFVRLFALFLSNFEYKWPWAHWNYVLDAQADDAQRLFVSAVIERCVRLSYRQHMQSILPETFHMLLPPVPVHVIRFRQAEGGDATMSSDGARYEQVFGKIKAREGTTAIEAWIDAQCKDVGLEMAVAALLDAGSATFTHFRTLLDKYLPVLMHAIDANGDGGVDRQVVVIATVSSVWEQSPQHVILILNILLRHRVLSPVAIVSWLFGADAVQQYSWPYVWEILDHTMRYALEQRPAADTAAVDELFVAVFEGLSRVIAAHKAQCDKDGTTFKDNWYASTLARLQSFGRDFRVALDPLLASLATTVFAAERAEHDVRVVFATLQASFQRV